MMPSWLTDDTGGSFSVSIMQHHRTGRQRNCLLITREKPVSLEKLPPDDSVFVADEGEFNRLIYAF